MQVVTDLHSHSKYARAVSSQMVLPVISEWCVKKGIDVVSTGDWTHPLWFKELQSQLEEKAEGLYKLKKWEVRGGKIDNEVGSAISHISLPNPASHVPRRTSNKETLFLLSTEVEVLYSQGGKSRKVHLLVFAPNFTAVEKINKKLLSLGKNLFSDGRPKMGMSAREIVEVALGADERCLVIPAHAWTPWFGIFGSMSGFDSLEECFGDLSPYIYGIETGLSSDPGMNWGIPELANRAILSFSDAHSPPKLGRELTVFEMEEVSYENMRKAIMEKWEVGNEKLDNELGSGKYNLSPQSKATPASHITPRISFTLEFYPEEGKYHYTGHRNCNVSHSPEDTKKLGVYCPKCRRPLTVGVMHRVDQLTNQSPIMSHQSLTDEYGVRWTRNSGGTRVPYVSMVPLLEILSESVGTLVSSQRVINEYIKLTDACENELAVLLKTKPEEIERISGPKTREAILRVRSGQVEISPGYDGVFGTVRIWPEKLKNEVEREQMGLF